MMNKIEPPPEASGSLQGDLSQTSPSAIPLWTVSYCSFRSPSQKIQPLRQQITFRGQEPLLSPLQSLLAQGLGWAQYPWAGLTPTSKGAYPPHQPVEGSSRRWKVIKYLIKFFISVIECKLLPWKKENGVLMYPTFYCSPGKTRWRTQSAFKAPFQPTNQELSDNNRNFHATMLWCRI